MRDAVDPEATVKALRNASRQLRQGFFGGRHLCRLILRSPRPARTTPTLAMAAPVPRARWSRKTPEQRLHCSAHFLLHQFADYRQQALVPRHQCLLGGGRYTNATARERQHHLLGIFRRIMLEVQRCQPRVASDRTTRGRYVRRPGMRRRCRLACACASRGRGRMHSCAPRSGAADDGPLLRRAIGWRARLQAQRYGRSGVTRVRSSGLRETLLKRERCCCSGRWSCRPWSSRRPPRPWIGRSR